MIQQTLKCCYLVNHTGCVLLLNGNAYFWLSCNSFLFTSSFNKSSAKVKIPLVFYLGVIMHFWLALLAGVSAPQHCSLIYFSGQKSQNLRTEKELKELLSSLLFV